MESASRGTRGRPGAVLAFIVSVLCGGITGSFLLTAIAFELPPINFAPVPNNGPEVVAFHNLLIGLFFSPPFCAIGLCFVGLPITAILHGRWISWWTAIAVTCLGGTLGAIWMEVEGETYWIGAVYGSSTAFWWWLLYRRVVIRREAAALTAVPET